MFVMLSVFGTAMLAQPTISQVEEVISFVHRETCNTTCASSLKANAGGIKLSFESGSLATDNSASIRRFGQANRERHAAAVTYDLDADGLSELMFVEHARQVVGILDLVAIDSNDDV